jgi:hypothetical protein
MRNILLAIALVLLPASAPAESSDTRKPDKFVPSGRQIPVKGASHGNSCAAYGPGFVKVEGTDTCVQTGGSVSIGAGTSFGR